MEKKLGIGSTNPTKIAALELCVPLYNPLEGAVVVSVDAPSMVSPQPMSMEEMVRGAKSRALYTQRKGNFSLSFGIESGFVESFYAKSGFINQCVCVIYDGMEFYVGLSSGFEVPPKVLSTLRLDPSMDLNTVFFKAGLTSDPKIGSHEGVVSVLTNGKVDRVSFCMEAITMAMARYENRSMYED